MTAMSAGSWTAGCEQHSLGQAGVAHERLLNPDPDAVAAIALKSSVCSVGQNIANMVTHPAQHSTLIGGMCIHFWRNSTLKHYFHAICNACWKYCAHVCSPDTSCVLLAIKCLNNRRLYGEKQTGLYRERVWWTRIHSRITMMRENQVRAGPSGQCYHARCLLVVITLLALQSCIAFA